MDQLRKLAFVVALTVVVCPVFAQGELPSINDAKVDCMLRVPYPMLEPLIAPGDEVDKVKVFFRAADQPDFYWVQASLEGDVYTAVLPTPSAETMDVVYYVEVVTTLGEVIQTEEYRAQVVDDEGECEDRKAAGLYSGENPNLVIGSTVQKAAAFPPGFDATGIVGSIGAGGGVVAAGGGGISPLLVGGIVAGSLAGVVILTDDDDSRPVSPIMP